MSESRALSGRAAESGTGLLESAGVLFGTILVCGDGIRAVPSQDAGERGR
jgi:hypothetical protein